MPKAFTYPDLLSLLELLQNPYAILVTNNSDTKVPKKPEVTPSIAIVQCGDALNRSQITPKVIVKW